VVKSKKTVNMFGLTDSAPKGHSCPCSKRTTLNRDSNYKNGDK